MKLRLTSTITAMAVLASPPAHAGGSKENVKTGNGDWQWSLSGGPSWHYMGRLNFSGGSRSQSHKSSGTKVRPGLFIEAVARYGLEGGAFIDGFLRGEIAEDFSVGVGPSRFKFEPIGYSIGARIGRSF